MFNQIKLNELVFTNVQEWIALKNLAISDVHFATHIGNLITTGLVAKSAFTLQGLCIKLLPKLDTDGQQFFLERNYNKSERIPEFPA